MQLEIRNNRDVWAGAMLIATGAGSAIIARDYAFGTSLRMGPGYFPSVLGGMLVLFGIYLVASGLRSNEKIAGGWSLRALVMLPLSLVMFGLLMEYTGFVPALMVLIVGSSAAGSEFNIKEALLLAMGLTAFAVALFIYGLGLPYPLFAAW
jgi:Tripartite tricarboxylate transporter TctB family